MLHYISDNPVTLQNRNDISPLGNLGLGVEGIEIYFPLSPHYSLAIYCNSYKTMIRSGFSEYLKKKRSGILDPREFPPTKIAALKRLKYGLETGNAVPSRTENVINRNSLHVMQSFRFVFSSDGDFRLIQEMIEHQPLYKDPPKVQIR